jgi:hypothetical protein
MSELLVNCSAHWEARLAAIEQLPAVNTLSPDQKAKCLAAQVLDARSRIASAALQVTTQLAGSLGVSEGAAELLNALVKVASNLRVKGLRDQAALALRALCSQQGDGPLFAALARTAEGTIKSGDFAQAIAMDLYLNRISKSSKEHRDLLDKARMHKAQIIRDVAKAHANH